MRGQKLRIEIRGRSVSNGADFGPAETSARGGMLLRECVASGVVSESDVQFAAANFLENSSAFKVASNIYATLPSMHELPQDLQSAWIEIVLNART